jgi:hypothetical protein
MSKNDPFGDERLKKDGAVSVRASRDIADGDRVHEDGMTLSASERRRLLRQDWVQEVLPKAPERAGWHRCWLSTTNSTDPVYKRIQRGYTPVKASDVPGFGSQFTVSGGEFDGCIACNEMLLFEIPIETYLDLMHIYHHDMPLEQEASVRERLEQLQESDSDGRRLVESEGDFNRLGRPVGQPTFIS